MASKFHELRARLFDEACESARAQVPAILYHYTDASGLVGMLQSGKLWATDCRYLNDKSELEHTRVIAREQVNTYLLSKSDSKSKCLLNHIHNYQKIEIDYDVFVFSLSMEKDDLSQWRAYAQDGQGFTIGFSAKKLLRRCLFRVEYDQEKQISTILNALKKFELEINSEMAVTGHLDYVCNQAAVSFDWFVEAIAALYKHQSFKAENEWRLIYYVERKDRKKWIKVRPYGNGLRNYIEFDFSDDNEYLPIESIGIGPGFITSNEVHSVKTLCELTGYNPTFYFADTPYRRSGA